MWALEPAGLDDYEYYHIPVGANMVKLFLASVPQFSYPYNGQNDLV